MAVFAVTCPLQRNHFVSCFQVSKAACILTTQHLMRILRSKEAAASVNIKTWPTIIDTGITTRQDRFGAGTPPLPHGDNADDDSAMTLRH